jgi:hypothetical protein
VGTAAGMPTANASGPTRVLWAKASIRQFRAAGVSSRERHTGAPGEYEVVEPVGGLTCRSAAGPDGADRASQARRRRACRRGEIPREQLHVRAIA